MEKKNSHGMDAAMAWKAVGAAFAKLTPQAQLTNPVMFLVYVSAILLTCLWGLSLAGTGDAPSGYTLAIVVMLWLTVLFSNYAEALAEGRGKAQADSLRKSKGDVTAHKVPSVERHDPTRGAPESTTEIPTPTTTASVVRAATRRR